jgi:hypothetical protein
MTELQEKFLYLAVIKKRKYDKIAEELKLDRKVFAPWWNELASERKILTEIRDKWQSKCNHLTFDDFKKWYNKTPKRCHYCKITENKLEKLWNKYPNLTKRKRGRKLEIERLKPSESYDNTLNLVFSCYWCNNAKTDTFNVDEFEDVGKVIEKIWQKRLNDI